MWDQSRRLLRSAFTISVLLLWAGQSNHWPLRADERVAESFEIRLVGKKFSAPENTLILSVDMNGNLWDMDSHSVNQRALASLLRSTRGEKPPAVRHIKLLLSDESNTSIAVLQKTLSSIRSHADSTRKTVIFVYLSGIA